MISICFHHLIGSFSIFCICALRILLSFNDIVYLPQIVICVLKRTAKTTHPTKVMNDHYDMWSDYNYMINIYNDWVVDRNQNCSICSLYLLLLTDVLFWFCYYNRSFIRWSTQPRFFLNKQIFAKYYYLFIYFILVSSSSSHHYLIGLTIYWKYNLLLLL